jgi:hypothetical protein
MPGRLTPTHMQERSTEGRGRWGDKRGRWDDDLVTHGQEPEAQCIPESNIHGTFFSEARELWEQTAPRRTGGHVQGHDK